MVSRLGYSKVFSVTQCREKVLGVPVRFLYETMLGEVSVDVGFYIGTRVRTRTQDFGEVEGFSTSLWHGIFQDSGLVGRGQEFLLSQTERSCRREGVYAGAWCSTVRHTV